MKILWATKNFAPDYAEELITEVEERIPDAIKWAKENGYGRFRISEFKEGEMPDFSKTISHQGGRK